MATTAMAKGLLALGLLSKNKNDDEEKSIHSAAKSGDIAEILKFSEHEQESDINIEDDRGHTPLFIATVWGHLELVELLLNRGAHQQRTENDLVGDTPLHVVGSPMITKLLIQNGGGVNAVNKFGKTPLHRAVDRTSTDVVDVLLEHGADINARTDDGLTPLHLAIDLYEPEYDIVCKLIAAGANVNDVDYQGRSPLHYYCNGYMFDRRIISLLIVKGCQLDLHDFQGNCAIHNLFTLQAFEDSDIEFSLLTLLCPGPEQLNLQDGRGRTPLMLNAIHMNVKVIETLLKLGADVKKRDFFCRTVLHYIKDSDTTEDIVSLFLKHGADINSEDNWGRSPLLHIISNNDIKCARVLIKHGAFVNQRDKCEITPLHLACSRGKEDTVKELIGYGANVNLADETGSTPLHAAAFAGRLDAVEHLLENNASLSIKDMNGFTPCQMAIFQGNSKTASLLQCSPSMITEFSSVANKFLKKEDAESMLSNGTCKRSKVNLCDYYSDILRSPLVGKGIDDAEAKEIQCVIENQVQSLAKKITELDDRFTCIVLHAGSSSEGTKTQRPDEFDFMFSLESFSSRCRYTFIEEDEETHSCVTINDSSNRTPALNMFSEEDDDTFEGDTQIYARDVSVSVSDYVKVFLASDNEADIFKQIMGSSEIGCGTMNVLFSELIERAVYSKDFPKDHRLIPLEVSVGPSLSFTWSGNKYKDMVIDIDIVPALRLPKWPSKLDSNSALFNRNLQRTCCMAVPKMTTGRHMKLWRTSLALIESAIFRNLRPEIRNSYITSKAITSSHFLPSIDFADAERESIKMGLKAEHPEIHSDLVQIYSSVEIPSYIFKMSFLSLIEERILKSDQSYVYIETKTGQQKCSGKKKQYESQSEDNFPCEAAEYDNIAETNSEVDVDLAKAIFIRSHKYLTERYVPSVFNKQHNVLSENFMLEGGIERAILYLDIILELIREEQQPPA